MARASVSTETTRAVPAAGSEAATAATWAVAAISAATTFEVGRVLHSAATAHVTTRGAVGVARFA